MKPKKQLPGNLLDRVIEFVAPRAALRRTRARVAAGLLARHYEGAQTSRRTQGWRGSSADANAAIGPALVRLREAARDLVRNNGHAESAVGSIADDVVGWGIVAKPANGNARAAAAWKAWAESKDCDADGINDFYGLQDLVVRTLVESGEVIIRRRFRSPKDGLSIPMQIQVLDPDHLDPFKHGLLADRLGNRMVRGVEFDAIGKRVAYWMFREHPGSEFITDLTSVRVPAEGVIHLFRRDRPGQVRGASWFAPVLLKFKDFDEYSDATLMKQKIAACLAVITSDPTGDNNPLGKSEDDEGIIDSLEPGMILNVAAGRTVETVTPPTVREHADYSRVTLHEIAAGLGVSYEDLTGDYSNVNFSSARMARLRHWKRVEKWRWQTVIPMFCNQVWAWAMEAAATMSLVDDPLVPARWTAPPLAMIEPDKEGLAIQRNVRTGIITMPEALRERGYDPDEVLDEIVGWNKKLDDKGIVLDSDPRKVSQAGLTQARPAGTVNPSPSEFDDGEPPEPAAPPAAPGKPGGAPADNDEEED